KTDNTWFTLLTMNTHPMHFDDEYAKETTDYELKNNDILITMTGTKNKRDFCFTVKIKNKDLLKKQIYLNQRVGALRFNPLNNHTFINSILKTNTLLDALFLQSTGSANQANLGKIAILKTILPLPPLPEQKVIVQKIAQLMAFCDALQVEIEQKEGKTLEWMESSMQAVLAQ
ncbi:MAG: restriction endonuclease subunit S, partial [Chitinophagales bacterium]